LKQCTTLLNDILKRDDAEYFLDPVDPDEVIHFHFILVIRYETLVTRIN